MQTRRLIATMVISSLMSSTAAMAQHCPATPAAFKAIREAVLHPPKDHVIVVAHRSCFAAAPENTPEAIDACWRIGVEVVENDVRSTADGELVVVHDDTIDRVTDGWGYLDDTTMADLAKHHMREREGGPGAFLTNVNVPTLRDYFRATKNKVMINLELKPSGRASFEELLVKSIKIAEEERVVDQLLLKVPDKRNHGKSSNKHILETLKIPAGLRLMPILWEADVDPIVHLGELEPYQGVGYEVPFLHPEWLSRIGHDPRLRGRPVMAVAVQPYWSGGLDDELSMHDPDAGWGKLIALGANTLMTNRPEALIHYLEGKGLRKPLATACIP